MLCEYRVVCSILSYDDIDFLKRTIFLLCDYTECIAVNDCDIPPYLTCTVYRYIYVYMPEISGAATLDLGSFNIFSLLMKSTTSGRAGAMKVSAGGPACLSFSLMG